MKNLKVVAKRFKLQENKKLIKKALTRKLNPKIKAKTYLLIDPLKNKVVRGSLKYVSNKLGLSKKEVREAVLGRDRVVKGNVKYTGFRFDNKSQLTTFLNKYKDDTKIPTLSKKKKKISTEELSQDNNLIKIINLGQSNHHKFGIKENTYQLDFNNTGYDFSNVREGLKKIVARATIKQKLGGKDKVRFLIEDPSLQHIISTPLTDLDQFNIGMVEKLVEKGMDSESQFQITNDTKITIVGVNMASGAGKKNMSLNLKENIYKKKSIIPINNEDNLCCGRAIALGITRLEKGTKSKEYLKQRQNQKYQGEKAKELYELCEVCEGECGLEQIKEFEYHTGYEINVISGDFMNEIIYPNSKAEDYQPKPPDKQIFLYHNNNHYDLIASNKVAGFLGKDYFCYQCKKCFKDKNKHNCRKKCNSCCCYDCPTLQTKLKDRKYDLQCQGCHRYFPNQTCFNNHLIKDTNGKSMCDKIFKCHKCNTIYNKDRFCMETHKCGEYLCRNCDCVVKKNHKCYLFPKPLKQSSEQYIFFDFESDISGEHHEVNFSVSQYYDKEESIIHYNIEEFCEWAFQEKHKGYTFIAHNGRGYDYKFVMRWLLLNTTYKPTTIYAGQKLMCFSVNDGLKIRFIDSVNFLTMPLSAFPSTFGETELKKGFFPHWFNILDNAEYVGKIPPMRYFGYKSFSTEKREEFIKWWVGKRLSNYVWDNEKELKEYCISDVDILKKCMIKFRALYLDVADIDPLQYITIAGVCMAIFKYYYILPSYPERYMEVKLKREFMDLSSYVELMDKFQKEVRKDIFTEKKIAVLKYDDAEWTRQGFFGGRTNAAKLLYNFNDGEEGCYSDITSLYPTVQYYDEYPMGHSKKIKEKDITEEIINKVKNKEFFGIVDCEVLPPDDLYHPVLARKGEKLMFDLLQKRGRFATPELNIAIDKGYKILKVFEVRYWDRTTRNLFKDYVSKFLKIKQEASGYPDWVKTEEDKDKYIADYHKNQGILLEKHKIIKNKGLRAIAKLCLNSLWGKFGQRTNMTKTKIIGDKSEFFKLISDKTLENINWYQIDQNKMEISYQVKEKYVKNDFNTNIDIACFTTSHARSRLYKALDLLGHQVLYFDTDSVVYVYNPNNPNHHKLANGDYCGEWTDELEGYIMTGTFVSGGPKNYSYEKTKDGITKYCSKVKGFGLNHEVSKRINHFSMIEVVNNRELGDTNKIEVQFEMIKRNKDHSLSNFTMDKNYGFCYDKRIILEEDINGNLDTIPFGFNPSKVNWIEYPEYSGEASSDEEELPSFLSED